MENAGFQNIRTSGQVISFEDPSCVLRAFANFAEYAWIALVCVTGLLLFGWAISMIRGAKNDIFTNMRNLILVLGIASVTGPVINVIFGDDLFQRGCKTIEMSVADIQSMLDSRNTRLSGRNENDLYEELDIYDSGAIAGTQNTPEEENVDNVDTQTITEEPQTDNPAPTGSDNGPVRAHESGRDVIYTYRDESKIRRSSGSRAWRNNNPGNIRPGRFSDSVGGIGRAGGFAAFPDEQTGMNAIVKLLKTSRYQSKTLGGAISAWAPPTDGNNTSSYQRSVERATGVTLNTPMNTLNDDQLEKIAQIIRKIEGWIQGKEKRE